MKKKIILCTHGRFGEEILESAKMIVGELNDVLTFSLLPGMSPETLMEQVESITKQEEEYICLVDLFGGTPCVTLSSMTRKYKIVVITGLNLAMLLEVYMALETSSLSELSNLAIKTLVNSGRVIPEINK